MHIANSAEDEDCRNWARWCWDNSPKLGYPVKWCIPDGPSDGPVERDRLMREFEEAEERAYDELRALFTDGLFRVWLQRYRDAGDYVGKRHFKILRAAYLLRMDVGELTVREALRALADLKAAQERAQKALERPLLRATA